MKPSYWWMYTFLLAAATFSVCTTCSYFTTGNETKMCTICKKSYLLSCKVRTTMKFSLVIFYEICRSWTRKLLFYWLHRCQSTIKIFMSYTYVMEKYICYHMSYVMTWIMFGFTVLNNVYKLAYNHH